MNERTPDQIRFETAWHESCHAVAGWGVGYEIARLELRPEMVPGAVAGQCHFADVPIEDVHGAIDAVCCSLAGDAGVRVAWALRVLSDSQIGWQAIPVDAEELAAQNPYALPSIANPAEAATYGVEDGCSVDDRNDARAIADQWTRTPSEAALLFGFCEAKVANDVAEERFQSLVGIVAPLLFDEGVVEGGLVMSLLYRQSAINDGRR